MSQHLHNLLTQEEVNVLPTDTYVIIIWSGGNGPFTYTIDNPSGATPIARECFHPIGVVGDYPFTQVCLA